MTVLESLELKRIEAGALEYKGHSYFDLERFNSENEHMIIFDVLNNDSFYGWKDDRIRLYIPDDIYINTINDKNINILSHATITLTGALLYDDEIMLK